MSENHDDFFGGAPTFSFKDTAWKGRPRGGMVIKPPEKVQQRNFDTGKPEFWDDGNPKMQLVVTFDTTKGKYPEKDPNNPADDGVRRLFIKGQMIQAWGNAFRKIGAPGFRVGGTGYVVWYDDEPQKKGNDKKIYGAQWTPPEPGANTDAIFSDAAPAQQAPAPADPWGQQSSPAQQQAPQQPSPAPAAVASADPFAATPPAAAPQAAPNPFA